MVYSCRSGLGYVCRLDAGETQEVLLMVVRGTRLWYKSDRMQLARATGYCTGWTVGPDWLVGQILVRQADRRAIVRAGRRAGDIILAYDSLQGVL